MDPFFSQQSSSSLTTKDISSWFWEVFSLQLQSMFCLLWSSAICSKQVLTYFQQAIACTPLCSRKASILRISHWWKGLKFPSDYLLPHHSCQPHSPFHDWFRSLCSFLSSLNTNSSQCPYHHSQHHSLFKSEHLNCSDNSCTHHLEHAWSNFGNGSPRKFDFGDVTFDKQGSAETSPTSSETERWLTHHWQKCQPPTSPETENGISRHWKKSQSGASCLSCTGTNQGFPRDSIELMSTSKAYFCHWLEQANRQIWRLQCIFICFIFLPRLVK